MMKTQNYDEETAKKVCGKLQAQIENESFSWVGYIKPFGSLIRGKALHPLKTVHPDEWPSVRVYLEEELQKSAHTLAAKPLLIDHARPLSGEVLGAEYDEGAIEYVAKLDDQNVLKKIRDGKIRHCSVEFEWKSLENVNGVAPRGISFTALSLLENFPPGDPLSSVEVWEGIIKQLKETKNICHDVHVREQVEPQEFILYQIRDPAAFLVGKPKAVVLCFLSRVENLNWQFFSMYTRMLYLHVLRCASNSIRRRGMDKSSLGG